MAVPAGDQFWAVDLSPRQRVAKRCFDIVVAASAILLVGWLIPIAAVGARLSSGQPGVFRQRRIGRGGAAFEIMKLRTMRTAASGGTTVTTASDSRVTRFGRILRRTKLDELPQLVNVLRGEMSLVGPRPDVPGFADQLCGHDRIVLSVRPGITGPAQLRFRDEESLLAESDDAERFNRDVLWPEKVRINREYVERWSFRDDLRYLWLTLRRGELDGADRFGDPGPADVRRPMS